MTTNDSKTTSWSCVLSQLGEDTLSVRGLAEALTGDVTSEDQRDIRETLSGLVEQGVVRSFEAGGVIWYRAVEAPLCPRPTPRADAGYAEEDPGDGRPDRLYGN